MISIRRLHHSNDPDTSVDNAKKLAAEARKVRLVVLEAVRDAQNDPALDGLNSTEIQLVADAELERREGPRPPRDYKWKRVASQLKKYGDLKCIQIGTSPKTGKPKYARRNGATIHVLTEQGLEAIS